MKRYLIIQKKKIEIDKWCEGCNLSQDPGQEYMMAWIEQNGAWFRQAWERSLCKSCHFSLECGHKVQQKCDNFQQSFKEYD